MKHFEEQVSQAAARLRNEENSRLRVPRNPRRSGGISWGWVATPVAAVADGLTAMHVTGPSKGQPFPLGLLGASPSAVALDEALCAVLGLPLAGTPLGAALERREAPGCRRAGWQPDYVLARPEDFDSTGFILPDELMHTSFRPWRLFKSCLRRLWLARRK